MTNFEKQVDGLINDYAGYVITYAEFRNGILDLIKEFLESQGKNGKKEIKNTRS